MLRKMTDGVGWRDAYSSTIERIKAQDEGKSGLGVAALMWVIYAERPLRADELCHALAVELGSKDFNAGNAPSISTLVGCCLGLITVDNETSTLRLVHPTLKEYFSNRTDIFSRPHSTIAEICLTYLNSEQVKSLAADHCPAIHDTPFLEYCSLYWGVHAKRDLSDDARSVALELFRKYDGHISSKLLLGQVKYLDGGRSASYLGNVSGSTGGVSSFGPLHCASFFGSVELVSTLLGMDLNIDGTDARGSTPLMWAARNGHEKVVEMLGCYEVRPNLPDFTGMTPLLYAIGYRHERVVEILLRQRGADPDFPDGLGKTPLSYAAQNGLVGAVKMLLERGGNPNKPDNSRKTPLSFAARSGHDRVVEILLGRTVSPDMPDLDGQTPLSYAASGGHEEVVKILLGWRGVNPDKPDKEGRTPLMCAASGGHTGVVKILLGREEVNPRKPDNQGQTPLMLATRLGFQEVTTLLQSHEAETPAQPEAQESTPH